MWTKMNFGSFKKLKLILKVSKFENDLRSKMKTEGDDFKINI